MTEALAELRHRPVSPADKGFAALASSAAVTAASLSEQRPDVFGGGFTMPLLVLRESALRQNVEAMARYCAAAGAELSPHGKTTMAPQLIARQLASGSWAVTAATIGQVRAYRAFGVPRVLLANELVDPAGVSWLAAELAADPGFECYCYVDSLAGVALLDELLARSAAGRPLPVLVELGYQGGRTGCRTRAGALAVARAAAATGSLRLAGAAGFEGSIGSEAEADTLREITGFCHELRDLSDALVESGLMSGPAVVSAGGSAYFDIVLAALAGARHRADFTVVLRSGCYLTHDVRMYADATPSRRGDAAAPVLTPALELWTYVLSCPEPGLALACAGRRDVSFDHGMPEPMAVRDRAGNLAAAEGMRVTRLDDQHAYVTVPPGSVRPGDLVCFGISHPCTTFDKWRVIPVVDDEYHVIDAVHTFF
jgi:D-serine deaminase-like pyridoxal phosphate-dependent protein